MPARLPLLIVCALVGLFSAACTSVRASTIRTGPLKLPAYAGDITVYSALPHPIDAVDLGVVEVRGVQTEATIENLLPIFLQKVAELGGDVAVVEGIRAHFDQISRSQNEMFYYTCGLSYTCAGSRSFNWNDEVLLVSIRGHAYSTKARAPEVLPASPAPADEAPKEEAP
jgi:hypothetical protein